MFPPSSLSTAEEVLCSVPGLTVEVHKLDPLVHRALLAASSTKDLRDLYDRIPTDVESKLMPFQREGIRFVLQHGGRALIADEMGLGKTLQAIAVASCLHDFWPVLVISPSSLRLHWASVSTSYFFYLPIFYFSNSFFMYKGDLNLIIYFYNRRFRIGSTSPWKIYWYSLNFFVH